MEFAALRSSREHVLRYNNARLESRRNENMLSGGVCMCVYASIVLSFSVVWGTLRVLLQPFSTIFGCCRDVARWRLLCVTFWRERIEFAMLKSIEEVKKLSGLCGKMCLEL